jgi:hypothetical protein
MLDKIYIQRYHQNLGLDSKWVSKFVKRAPLPAGATALNFTPIATGSNRPLSAPLEVVVARNDAEWTALVRDQLAGVQPRPVPPVDFNKQTVAALFYLQHTSCWTNKVTDVYMLDGQVVVYYVWTWTAIDWPCNAIDYQNSQVLTIDIPAASNVPVVLHGESNRNQ